MKNSIIIVMAVAVALLILQKECDHRKPVEPVKIEWVFDTTSYEASKPPPEPSVIIEREVVEKIIEIPANVDTAALLADYYRMRLYTDTLVNNEDLLFVLKDTVHQNRLRGRRYEYVNFRPVDVEVTCPEVRKLRLYIGGSVGGRDRFGAGPSAAIQTQSGLYTYKYDAINKEHWVGVHWGLFKGYQ